MQWIDYDEAQKQELNFVVQVTDTGGAIVASSDGIVDDEFSQEMFDRFTITIDQLEGEINIPYEFDRRIYSPVSGVNIPLQVIRVPYSLLGGFAQFRINYQYIHYDDEDVVNGSIETPRVLIPRIPPPPPEVIPPALSIDENQIREAFADKIYEKFFNSDLIDGDLGDIKSYQTTVSEDGIGYKIGRESEDDQLIIFKKDRNTPENIKDFQNGETQISSIISYIMGNLEAAGATGLVDISDKLDNEVTITSNTPMNQSRISSLDLDPPIPFNEDEPDSPLFYLEIRTFNINYNDGNFSETILFAERHSFYQQATGDLRQQITDEEGNTIDRPDEWVNKLNLSQLTEVKFGTKINPDKARFILDTNIIELLPNQAVRQRELNTFYQTFLQFIGAPPTFEDVDEDGVGESLTSDPSDRINEDPNNNEAVMVRINDDNYEGNLGTLENMRNTLNQYLQDVDNEIQEVSDSRPEYENKSEGFVKIRRLNQAVVLQNITDDPMEFEKTVTRGEETVTQQVDPNWQPNMGGPPPMIDVVVGQEVTGPTWALDGITVTMWVRFLNNTTGGTLMTYGNPLLKIKPSFRIDSHVETFEEPQDDNPSPILINRRMVRLVVYENFYYEDGAIFDSHVGINGAPKYNTLENVQPALEGSTSDPLIVFNQHTQIPTDDLNEWFFICATYNPLIKEEQSNNVSNMLEDSMFWLNHRMVSGGLVANSTFGNRCKVEVISRSDLLRARGFKVD